MSTPAERHAEWIAASDTVATIGRAMIGQRIRYVGLTGRADGPTGRITRIARDGLRVRWEHERHDETVHPDDVVWLTAE